jgi:hypothetical protein
MWQLVRYGLQCSHDGDTASSRCRYGELTPLQLGRSTEIEPIFTSTARVRNATPEPDSEAKDTVAFVDLPTDEQLRRIRPYLQRVIREECPPAQERNDLFYLPRNAGREKLMESKNTGDVSDSEATDMFIPELERWALRADRWIGFPEDKVSKRSMTAIRVGEGIP